MKPKDEQAVIASIRREFLLHPHFQDRVRVSAQSVTSNAALVAHRGWQVGIYDAYKALRKDFPIAAKFLLEQHGMSRDGTIRL